MAQTDKTSTVPKFGSFKPKAPAKPANRDDKVKSERNTDRDDHRDSKDRDRHRHIERLRHDGDGSTHRRHKSASRHSAEAQQLGPPDEFEESPLFITDKRGDNKNVDYGSLHRYSIPLYHRTGYGRVLGTPYGVKLDRDESTEKEVVLRSFDGRFRGDDERPLTSNAARKCTLGARAVRRVLTVANAEDGAVEGEADFISLRRRSFKLKRKRGSESPEPEAGAGIADYRSIEGKAKPDTDLESEDEDLESACDSDNNGVEDPAHLSARSQNAALTKQAKEHPTEINAWLALIASQTSILHPGADENTLATLRLPLHSKALKHIPGDERLLLGRLKEGSKLWEISRLRTEWISAISAKPSSVEIWKGYLNLMQTDHAAFDYEKCRVAYLQCLRALCQTGNSEQDKHKLATAKVYILLRYTSFIRDAGYDELAHATWQIVLEYYFCRPSNLEGGRESELEALEDFWESDAPRIGEKGAKGWDYYYSHRAEGVVRQSAAPAAEEVERRSSAFARFAQREAGLAQKLHLPAAIADGEVDDPFRYVMFSDLKEVVECLSLEALPKRVVLSAWLCFMGMPLLPYDEDDSDHEDSSTSWTTDPFIRTARGDGHGLHNELTTTSSLFHSSSSFPHTEQDEANFISNTLSSLTLRHPTDDTLSEYHLAFKLHAFPNEAVKTAKRLLKARPSSLRLYNAYALIEARLGRLEKAEEVWSAALTSAASFREGGRGDGAVLWHSWVMTLLSSSEGAEERALRVLVAIADEGFSATGVIKSAEVADVTATQRLKATRHLEHAIATSRLGRAMLYIDLLAWLCYLSQTYSLEAASNIYTTHLKPASTSSTSEHLHQLRARIIHHHILTNKRPHKPALIRSELAQNLDRFPENSIFLNLYHHIGRSRIDDQLREAVAPFTPRSEGLVAWHFRLTNEIQRSEGDTPAATANGVRALFRSALLESDSKVRHSLALWRLWWEFEIQTRSVENVRRVFYDGLRYLPWCKKWVLMALGWFSDGVSRGGMTDGELRRVYEVLGEREMRIRVAGDIDVGGTAIYEFHALVLVDAMPTSDVVKLAANRAFSMQYPQQ
ncbi:hypothetical protein LTR37_013393 [Vermiconidia calcicola]|uniref:Uncharacterized protein n=1 Tax=Vermiconidia calcicola TaxID=1690605 RepID=A0ACC3MWH9_9PEZI|nr:hypothetical protein LTR37_013393 [Vermiconidia calcicola]